MGGDGPQAQRKGLGKWRDLMDEIGRDGGGERNGVREGERERGRESEREKETER